MSVFVETGVLKIESTNWLNSSGSFIPLSLHYSAKSARTLILWSLVAFATFLKCSVVALPMTLVLPVAYSTTFSPVSLIIFYSIPAKPSPANFLIAEPIEHF